MLGALMLAESFRPSLLPRTLVTQVGLSALAAVTGYAIGAVAGAIGRVIITRITGATASARFVQPIGLSMAVIAVAVAFAHASGRLQLQAGQRAALGLDAAVPSTLLVLVGATVGAILMVLLGRCLRGGARRLGRPLTARLGWSPRSATIAGGVLETAICLVLVAGLVALVRPVSASRDRRIGAGESALRCLHCGREARDRVSVGRPLECRGDALSPVAFLCGRSVTCVSRPPPSNRSASTWG